VSLKMGKEGQCGYLRMKERKLVGRGKTTSGKPNVKETRTVWLQQTSFSYSHKPMCGGRRGEGGGRWAGFRGGTQGN